MGCAVRARGHGKPLLQVDMNMFTMAHVPRLGEIKLRWYLADRLRG